MQAIYLDYNATTPVAPEVREAMLPYFGDEFGNPSSSHALGQAAHAAVEIARERVASLLGAAPDEIVFTSCGTECNNLALAGVLLRGAPPLADHLVISALEHPAIVEPARFLRRLGCEVTVVPCDCRGVVDPDDVARALPPRTRLVSIMHANNEVGTLQPVREIARLCRAHGVLVHTDAAQSLGKVPVNVDDLGVDLLTVAGHKLYAPKGVGALYVRRGTKLEPLLHGAGHERGLRSGTENVPYLVGLGMAAELAARHLLDAAQRMAALRDRLQSRLREALGERMVVHGEHAPRLPNTLSIAVRGADAHELLRRSPALCASTGAACHSGSTKVSATLAAMQVGEDLARATLRLSLGRPTTEEEVDRAAELLLAACGAGPGAPGMVVRRFSKSGP
jgi:cysteine desulfurase